MANIHHSAARGFANSAATYVSGRPEYPREVDDWLRSDLGLGTGKAALDLGAGTGKFLARLRVAGAALAAVEPVPAMLEQLIAANPDVIAKLGSAEHIPFSDSNSKSSKFLGFPNRRKNDSAWEWSFCRHFSRI
jgi:SAM-dependent methyltransferase